LGVYSDRIGDVYSGRIDNSARRLASAQGVLRQWQPGFDASSLAWRRYDHAVAVDEFEPLADRDQPNPAARTLRIGTDAAIDNLQANLDSVRVMTPSSAL
jgi:hypothetical protein